MVATIAIGHRKVIPLAKPQKVGRAQRAEGPTTSGGEEFWRPELSKRTRECWGWELGTLIFTWQQCAPRRQRVRLLEMPEFPQR